MTIFFCLESLSVFFAAIYFMFISQVAAWLLLGGLFMQFVGTVAVFFIPESPKWLIKKGELDAAINVFKRIAKTN